jgi:hypothetical protein
MLTRVNVFRALSVSFVKRMLTIALMVLTWLKEGAKMVEHALTMQMMRHLLLTRTHVHA